MMGIRMMLLGTALALTACHNAETRSQPTAGAVPAFTERTVDQVAARSAALDGEAIAISGRFMGWKGSCMGPPPNRSAWMLEGAQSCLYVVGPVPQSITPPPSEEDLGREVTVSGRVQHDRAGRPYLYAR